MEKKLKKYMTSLSVKKKTIINMPTKLKKCTCKDEFQDKRYGKGRRVMNQAPAKGAMPNRYRCTVCGEERGSR